MDWITNLKIIGLLYIISQILSWVSVIFLEAKYELCKKENKPYIVYPLDAFGIIWSLPWLILLGVCWLLRLHILIEKLEVLLKRPWFKVEIKKYLL